MAVIEARAVISATDATGGVFEKIAGKFKEITKSAQSMKGMKPMAGWGADFQRDIDKLKSSGKEIDTVRRSWESFNAALKSAGSIPKSLGYTNAISEWKSRTLSDLKSVRAGLDQTERHQAKFMQRGARFAAGAIGAGSAAYLANRGVRATVSSGANMVREDARDYLAGLSDDDSKRLKGRAMDLSSRYNSVDANTMHERLRDTAMSVRSVDKASELGETIAQGTVVLQSLKGKDKAIEEGRKFFKALDTLGKNVEPAQVKGLFNGYIKAMGVEGADLDLGGVLKMARQSRAAGGVLSDRFMMTTGVGLQGDMGDAQVGTALSSSLSQTIGGRATKTSKAAQQDYGLRDKQGNFLDTKMAMENPDTYAWEKVIPALQRKGIDANDGTAVAAAMSKLFSNRVVADLFSKMISQRDQYQGKAEQYDKAPGLSAAKELPGRDPFVAAEGFVAQLKNLAAKFAEPVFPAAIAAMSSMSSAIGDFTKSFSEDDKAGKVGKGLAVGIGGAGAAAGGVMAAKTAYQWFTGTGALNSSAALLSKSAVELTAAAAALSGMGTPAGKAATAATTAATTAGATAAPAAAGAAGGGIWSKVSGAGSAALAIPYVVPALIGGAALAAGAIVGAIKEKAGTTGLTGSEAATKASGGSRLDHIRKSFNEDRERFGIAPTQVQPSAPAEPVKAEIEGNATLSAAITVAPSAFFMTTIDQKIDNKINAFRSSNVTSSGTSGSTGRSSPDAGSTQ